MKTHVSAILVVRGVLESVDNLSDFYSEEEDSVPLYLKVSAKNGEEH